MEWELRLVGVDQRSAAAAVHMTTRIQWSAREHKLAAHSQPHSNLEEFALSPSYHHFKKSSALHALEVVGSIPLQNPGPGPPASTQNLFLLSSTSPIGCAKKARGSSFKLKRTYLNQTFPTQFDVKMTKHIPKGQAGSDYVQRLKTSWIRNPSRAIKRNGPNIIFGLKSCLVQMKPEGTIPSEISIDLLCFYTCLFFLQAFAIACFLCWFLQGQLDSWSDLLQTSFCSWSSLPFACS